MSPANCKGRRDSSRYHPVYPMKVEILFRKQKKQYQGTEYPWYHPNFIKSTLSLLTEPLRQRLLSFQRSSSGKNFQILFSPVFTIHRLSGQKRNLYFFPSALFCIVTILLDSFFLVKAIRNLFALVFFISNRTFIFDFRKQKRQP